MFQKLRKQGKLVMAVWLGVLIAGALFVYSFGFGSNIFFKDAEPAPSAPISAMVTGINYTPNVYENGYYSIELTDARLDENYIINATGFMNLPYNPDGYDFDCVEAPPREELVGKTVRFYLPYSDNNQSNDAQLLTSFLTTSFSTCFDKDASNAEKFFIEVTPEE